MRLAPPFIILTAVTFLGQQPWLDRHRRCHQDSSTMLHYRRKSFDRIQGLLREIVQAPEAVDKVLSCQQMIYREIVRAERHIMRLKKDRQNSRTILRTSRPSRTTSVRLKKQIKSIEARIDAYWQLIYIWRCFGDGLAFVYLDRYGIKQTYFETATSSPKQDVGFISGKAGIANEIAVVESAIKAGVPAILVDLTSSIRHGDVCLLGENDPYLIEVKSGERLNDRGRRQTADIDALHRFFDTDEAVGLRGFPKITRVEAHSVDRTYVDEMNGCIERAQNVGYDLINPERGLYYLSIYRPGVDLTKVFGQMDVRRPIVFDLNSYKSGRGWAPYYPFTLSIVSNRHLYDFIRGELYLLVILDRDYFSSEAASLDILVNFEDDTGLLSREEGPGEGKVGISNQFLVRIGLEFLSPRWILEHAGHSLARARTRVEASDGGAVA
jgi:hypothetical protein